MAVVPCFVVVDLPVRKVFLLQAVHRIAEWLGPESAVLRGRTFLVWGVFVLFVSHFLKSIILRRMRSHQRPSFLRCRHCYYVSLFPIELVRLARLLLVFRLALNALQSSDVSTLRLFCLQVLATRSLGWQ